MPFLTLCSLRGDFGEEGNLGHRYKGQTQNLQKHPNDELSQLPRKSTYRKQSVAEEKTPNRLMGIDTCMLYWADFDHKDSFIPACHPKYTQYCILSKGTQICGC